MRKRSAWFFWDRYQYFKWIGFKEGVLFLILNRMKRKCLRKVHLANEDLYVRTATSDLNVVATCLITKEYGNIELSDPSVIIDAGANIGASAIYFSRKYPHAKIFAIEPEQENYDILLKNTNKFKNIIPVKAALWGQKETRVIQDRLTGPWGHTVSETNNKTRSTGQEVGCITISSLLNDHNLHHIDLLKMDIEGGEKNVLENSDDWIGKVNVISAELHDRICMGCDRAFYLATKDFARFEKNGEKVTAYRN